MNSSKQYDKKIFRIISILNALNKKKTVLSRELAEDFKVTLRTVQRDIELLNMTGFPILMIEKGKYGFMKGFSLDKMSLTEREASLIAFFQDISASLGIEFQQVYAGLVDKMLTSNISSPYFFKVPQIDLSIADMKYWKDLENAIQDNCKVSIVYEREGIEKSYLLNPLKLVNYEGFWYLLTFNESVKAIRSFRLEKIRAIEITDDNFLVPDNLQTMLRQSTSIWFSGKRDTTVVLEVNSKVAGFIKKKQYFPLQKICKEKKDGTLIVESKVDNFMEVIPTLYHWIPYINVISPDELKRKMADDLQIYLQKLV